MAAVSAWAKPGAWALESEENEEELLQQHKEDTTAGNGHSNGGATADFPSLSVAAATKTKKKKPQNMSLQEFATYVPSKSAAAAQTKGLTTEELMALPTGPRERTAEELDRGKGFRSYGVGGGMREERRQGSFNRDSPREFTPSRADETDDWAAGKKSSASSGFDRRERGERGGFFSDSQSRADDVDNWVAKKSFTPSEPRRLDRRGSFGLESSNGGADSGNWGRKSGGAFDSLENRRGGGFESNGPDSESWGRRREEVSVGTGGGSRPKLNLQPRTLPVEPRTPPVVEEQRIEPVIVAKPKGSNPFGAARPREEVLKEKGQDWKEIEEKLESAKIKDVSAASIDGPAVEKKGFWRGNGRERLQEEVKTERAWRKPGLDDSSPQSANGSESGVAENNGNGHTEEAEEEDTQM